MKGQILTLFTKFGIFCFEIWIFLGHLFESFITFYLITMQNKCTLLDHISHGLFRGQLRVQIGFKNDATPISLLKAKIKTYIRLKPYMIQFISWSKENKIIELRKPHPIHSFLLDSTKKLSQIRHSLNICYLFLLGMMELLYQRKNYKLLLHATLIYKALKTKLWYDSRYVSRQLEGIGESL